jgi:hypothetical protein
LFDGFVGRLCVLDQLAHRAADNQTGCVWRDLARVITRFHAEADHGG